MGVLYTVVPLNDEVRIWLEVEQVAVPFEKVGRLPTSRELLATARCLERVEVDVYGEPPHQIGLESSAGEEKQLWTLINLTEPQGLDEPVDFGFEKGTPELIVDFLILLAESTGPLVLIPDTGELPVVICAGDDAASVIATWEHTRHAE